MTSGRRGAASRPPRSGDDLLQVTGPGNHDEDDVAAAQVAERAGDAGAPGRERLGLRPRPVPDRDLLAGVEQPGRHRGAHPARAEPADPAHGMPAGPARPATRAARRRSSTGCRRHRAGRPGTGSAAGIRRASPRLPLLSAPPRSRLVSASTSRSRTPCPRAARPGARASDSGSSAAVPSWTGPGHDSTAGRMPPPRWRSRTPARRGNAGPRRPMSPPAGSPRSRCP